VIWILVREVCFVEVEVRAVVGGAGEEGAVFRYVEEQCMSVFDAIFVDIIFEISEAAGCGAALWLMYEYVWMAPAGGAAAAAPERGALAGPSALSYPSPFIYVLISEIIYFL
jgi:hypothetical protein